VEKEFRRIQFTGGSTYTLSLPKQWVEKSGLSKGSLVRLTEREGPSLLISPEEIITPSKIGQATIVVTSSDSPERVVRRVVSAYISGFNIIKIKSGTSRIDTSVKIAVKETARKKFIGTEILCDSPDELTLQVLIQSKELSIVHSLKRMADITASMHRDAYQAIKSGDVNLAKHVIDLDDDVDRFNLYCSRLVKTVITNPKLSEKIGVGNTDMCLGYRSIAKIFERIADHAVNIVKNQASTENTNTTTLDVITDLGNIALSVFESSVEAVTSKDYEKAEHVITSAEEGRRKIGEIIQKSHSKSMQDISQYRLIIESILRTVEYSKDVAETIVNMTIEDHIAVE
jgi:phosphate uptake regulator